MKGGEASMIFKFRMLIFDPSDSISILFDVFLRVGVFDAAFVLWGPAGLPARVGHERAIRGDAGVLLVTDGVFVERTRRRIPVDFADG